MARPSLAPQLGEMNLWSRIVSLSLTMNDLILGQNAVGIREDLQKS